MSLWTQLMAEKLELSKGKQPVLVSSNWRGLEIEPLRAIANALIISFEQRKELDMDRVILKSFARPDEISEFERGKFETIRVDGLVTAQFNKN